MPSKVFDDLLETGRMRFLVVAEDLQFNRLPPKIEVPKARRANREDGAPFQRNLFDVTTEDDLSPFENKVATYLGALPVAFVGPRQLATHPDPTPDPTPGLAPRRKPPHLPRPPHDETWRMSENWRQDE